MKLTQKQLEQVLKALQLDAEVVENESDSDFDMEDVLNKVDSTRGAILRPQWEQEHTSKIESAVNGKIGNIITRQLAEITGIDKSKLTSDMKDTDKIRTAFEHYKSTLGADEQSTAKKVQELIDAHKNELTTKESEWKQQLDAANEKYVSRDMRDYVNTNILKDAPLSPTLDRNVASQDLYSHLQSKYTMKWNEQAKKIEFFDKENPNMPALRGNQTINPLDDAKEYFTPRGNWATDMRNVQHDPNKGQPYTPNRAAPQTKTGSSGNTLATLNAEMEAALAAGK